MVRATRVKDDESDLLKSLCVIPFASISNRENRSGVRSIATPKETKA